MRVQARFCLGIVLGFTCGAIPLAVAHFIGSQVDPFDHGISYVVWLGGSFIAALGLAYFFPPDKWMSGLAVFGGFLGAIILDIVLVGPNLWPLTLAFSTMIGTPTAFAGAYLGAKLRSR